MTAPSCRAFTAAPLTFTSHSADSFGSVTRSVLAPRDFTKIRASVAHSPSRETWLVSLRKSTTCAAVSPGSNQFTFIPILKSRPVYCHAAKVGALLSTRNSAGSSVGSITNNDPSLRVTS